MTALIAALRDWNDKLLITMSPETVNFSRFWGWGDSYNNYSVVINQLNALNASKYRINWVQIQLYNSGSPDGTPINTALFAEAFAFDQLAGWTIKNNTFSGLEPDQIVLGFPATLHASGTGLYPLAEIKKAYNCLLNGIGCSLTPPSGKVFPYVGGIMNWSANWDASGDGGLPKNSFSTTLRECIMTRKNCDTPPPTSELYTGSNNSNSRK